MEVSVDNNTVEAHFYRSDKNPIQHHSERFDHSFVDLPNGSIFQYVERSNVSDEAINRDDIRYQVSELSTDTDYWIIDACDDLGDYFPAVPDVPGHSSPTYFVAVPREKVVQVFSQ